MSTPDDEVTLCRDECTFDRAALPLPLEVRLATSCSRSELRVPSSLSPRLSLPSRFCISYRPLLSTVAADIYKNKSHDARTDQLRRSTRSRTDFSPHSLLDDDDDDDVSFSISDGDRSPCRAYLVCPRKAADTATRRNKNGTRHDTTLVAVSASGKGHARARYMLGV